MLKALFITLLIILAIVFGWHILFPILGGVIAISAAAWTIMLAAIVIFCVAILFIFVLTGVGALILGIVFGGWTLVAIFLFPILFPILLPLFIIFLFISFFRRHRSRPNNSNYRNL